MGWSAAWVGRWGNAAGTAAGGRMGSCLRRNDGRGARVWRREGAAAGDRLRARIR